VGVQERFLGMQGRCVVVLMQVMVRAVLELAQQAARVAVGDVVVVVRVHHLGMHVLVVDIHDHVLSLPAQALQLIHGSTSRC
jgi:hypothetical protein